MCPTKIKYLQIETWKIFTSEKWKKPALKQVKWAMDFLEDFFFIYFFFF